MGQAFLPGTSQRVTDLGRGWYKRPSGALSCPFRAWVGISDLEGDKKGNKWVQDLGFPCLPLLNSGTAPIQVGVPFTQVGSTDSKEASRTNGSSYLPPTSSQLPDCSLT